MTSIKELNAYARDCIAKHPQLKSEIVDLYQLAMMEIEDGECVESECDKAFSDIRALINTAAQAN